MQTSEGAIVEVLDALTKGETWRLVGRYDVHRYRPDGEGQDVTVEIKHRPDVGYLVVAVDGTRKLRASGNPNPDLDATLRMVHWFELDREPRR